MQEISIQYITVIPKGKDRWKYYINDNFQDSHSIKTDDLKNFILKRVKSPAIATVIEFISKYFSFIVDISNNKVYRLNPRNTKETNKDIGVKNALKDYIKKEQKESNKDYNKNNEDLLNSLIVYES